MNLKFLFVRLTVITGPEIAGWASFCETRFAVIGPAADAILNSIL